MGSPPIFDTISWSVVQPPHAQALVNLFKLEMLNFESPPPHTLFDIFSRSVVSSVFIFFALQIDFDKD